jgi:hypothetical protein
LPPLVHHGALHGLAIPDMTVGLQQRGQNQHARFDRRFAPRRWTLALGQRPLQVCVEQLMAYRAQKDKELPRLLCQR